MPWPTSRRNTPTDRAVDRPAARTSAAARDVATPGSDLHGLFAILLLLMNRRARRRGERLRIEAPGRGGMAAAIVVGWYARAPVGGAYSRGSSMAIGPVGCLASQHAEARVIPAGLRVRGI
jgi:hypothetical protein